MSALRVPAGILASHKSYKFPQKALEEFDRLQANLTKSATLLEEFRHEASQSNDQKVKDLEPVCKKAIDDTDKEFKKILDQRVYAAIIEEAMTQTVQYSENRSSILESDHITANYERFESMTVSLFRAFQEYVDTDMGSLKNLPESDRLNGSFALMYKEFRKAIFYASHYEDEEMPNIEQYFSDYQEEDMDFIVEQEKASYKCPLTKLYYENPVTSRKCNHSFSKAAIVALVGRGSRKCPIPACNHVIKVSDLVPNPELERKTTARRQRDIDESQQATSNLQRI